MPDAPCRTTYNVLDILLHFLDDADQSRPSMLEAFCASFLGDRSWTSFPCLESLAHQELCSGFI